jgi:putative transposase
MNAVLLSLLQSLSCWMRSRAALQFEIVALRHQLLVLQRTRPPRLPLAAADRLLWVWLSRMWSQWRSALVIVKPETVIAWHRRGSDCSGPGRAAVALVDRSYPQMSGR